MGCIGSVPIVKEPSQFPEPISVAAQIPTSAAIIGAGHLGIRIVAELLLLGSRVTVFDQALSKLPPLRAQMQLNRAVSDVLQECESQGLLRLAGMGPLRSSHSDCSIWEAFEGEGPRAPLLCSTVAEAVQSAEIVIEAVPEVLLIKGKVLGEVADVARNAILVTSTLTLSLEQVQAAVSRESKRPQMPKVVGLRFIMPVVFVPFVEVTLTEAQQGTGDKEALMGLLQRLGKTVFIKLDGKQGADGFQLGDKSAKHWQSCEAQSRRAHRIGPEAVAALGASEHFGLGADCCHVCLRAAPSVAPLLCGHAVLCAACVHAIASNSHRCPVCRAQRVTVAL